MDFLQLKYFQIVARTEHMTKAAMDLKISQPSLSKMISRLEEDLGVQLFNRKGRQIKLNMYGQAFLRRVDRIFLELEEGRKEIRDLAGLEQGLVSFAVTNPRILPELLEAFLRQYPNVHFRQFLGSTLSMQHQLENGEIDLCISSIPLQGPDIEWKELITEEIFLIVPPGHRLSTRDTIDLYEVADEPFIGLSKGHGFRDITDEFCLRAGFTPDIAFEGDEPAVIRELVEKGLGVAFIPSLSWSGVLDPQLHLIHIRNPVCERTVGIARVRNRSLSKASRLFYDFVASYLPAIKPGR